MSGDLVERHSGSPYVGIVPFCEDDENVFCGREHETALISSNLLSSRLTLLYGPSGVGKSSVLNAGVVPHLRRLGAQNANDDGVPEFVTVVYSVWSGDPIRGLIEQIRATLADIMAEAPDEPPEGSLLSAIQVWTNQYDVDLLIILDQFEEYFIYHGGGQPRGSFVLELASSLQYRKKRQVGREEPRQFSVAYKMSPRANFLLSFREDFLAKLDVFKGLIPSLFQNYLRLDYLTADQARKAIEVPIQRHREVTGKKIQLENDLVDAVLKGVRVGGQRDHRVRAEPAEGTGSEFRVETAFLQLVMTRVWDTEMNSGSSVLRAKTLSSLGGIDNVIDTHLDKALEGLTRRQQSIVAKIFRHLVTSDGYKVAHSAGALEVYTGFKKAEVTATLMRLTDSKELILRRVPGSDPTHDDRFEIYHDKLAEAVIDWSSRHNERRKTRRRHYSSAIVGICVILAAVIMLGQTTAERSGRIEEKARADSLERRASVLARTASTPDRQYMAMATDERLSVIDLVTQDTISTSVAGKPRINSLTFAPSGEWIAAAAANGSISLWSRNLEERRTLPSRQIGIGLIEISPSGRFLASASADSTVRVWNVDSGEDVMLYRYANPIAGVFFLRDESGIVAIEEGGRIAHKCSWYVLVGGDRDLPAAKWELGRVTRDGYFAAIYFYGGSYRTAVGPYCNREEASLRVSSLQHIRRDAYVQDVSQWCRTRWEFRNGYLECRS